MSAACPFGHDWDNSLVCRLCPATRTPEEAILSGLASRRGGSETSARTLLDAYRIGVLTEVTAWLVKKARVFRSAGGSVRAAQADAVAALASKVDRGAVRANNLRTLPATDADFFQPGRTYTREHHGRTIEFLVRSVDTPPDSTWQVAFGFRRDEDGDWEPTDSDDLTGWTDATETEGR